MSALDTWKALSTFEMDLPSGTHVKGRYIDFETALMGGGFDFSVLEGLREVAASDREPTTDEQTAAANEGLRYKRFVVCACLLEVEGEAVTLGDDDYALIPEPDRDAFYKQANNKPVPFEEAS